MLTFVVSNINTILSQSKKKRSKQEKCFSYLEKIRVKYELSKEAINMAKREINKGVKDFFQEDIDKIPKHFPPNLKNELYLSMYRDRMNSINIFKALPEEVVITLGHALTPIIYTPSINIFLTLR